MKIISVLGVIAASIIAISCANLNNNTKTDTSITAKTTAQWKDKAPQLFANAGYGLVESNTNAAQNKFRFLMKYIGDNESLTINSKSSISLISQS